MGPVTRKVTVTADDPKRGMTSLELLTILAQTPEDLVPKVEIGLNGRVKKITVEVDFRAQ
jgi:hypothetical protein